MLRVSEAAALDVKNLDPGIDGLGRLTIRRSKTDLKGEGAALSWVNTLLGSIKRSLNDSYHSVSSKHLPQCLAEFSYRFNRRFSLREMFPRLAFVVLRTPPMPNRVLKLAENYA